MPIGGSFSEFTIEGKKVRQTGTPANNDVVTFVSANSDWETKAAAATVVKTIIGLANPTANVIATATGFMSIVGNESNVATENTTQQAWPIAGTFKNAYVVITANTNAASNTITFRKGGVSQAIVITVPATTTGTFSDTTNTATVVAADLVNWLITGSGAVAEPGSGPMVEFDPT